MDILNKKIVNKQERPVKVIQMGEGNFLRGFCDTFINRLNNKTKFNGNVCLVQPRDSKKIHRFWDQDLLYTSITEGYENDKFVSYSEVIDCIGDAIDPYSNYKDYLKYAESKDLQVYISNTTESGIYFEKTDTNLNVTPKSFPAKLLAFLKRRYETFGNSKVAGLYILPCELITNNGNTLKSILIKLAKLNNLEEEFISWMINCNKFYNTLVDRIIPGFPSASIDKWQERWGYIDNLAVKGEIYHLWCLQGDKSLFNVLPFNQIDSNIILCDNITPYKERKVKILNGSHTMLVPTVYQLGYRIVNKTVNDDDVKKMLDSFIEEEVIPSIDLPKKELNYFKNSVIDRFANPSINHYWASIMLNSMSKYKERIIPIVKYNFETENTFPKYSLYALASLVSLCKINIKQNIFEDDKVFMDMWKKLFDGKHSNKEIINYVLNIDYWEFDFSKYPKIYNYILKCYDSIENNGMEYTFNLLINDKLN